MGVKKGKTDPLIWAMYLETNACSIRALCSALLTAHERVPEVQERCNRMKPVCVTFLLFRQHTIADTGGLPLTTVGAVCCIALEVSKHFHRQSFYTPSFLKWL